MSEYQKINEYIKDFLKYNGYSSTLECLEAEERMMKVTSKTKQSIKAPSDVSIVSFYLFIPIRKTLLRCTVFSKARAKSTKGS